MLEFLNQSQNTLFTISLLVMVVFCLLEGLSLLVGVGLSQVLDNLLPDFDFLDLEAEFELDGELEAPSVGPLVGFLDWLHVGRVPILVLLVSFLTGFGIIGLAIQGVLQLAVGVMLPGIIVAVPALLGTIPVVRVVGSTVLRIMPEDDTEAVSEASFVGLTAVITGGTARHAKPAQARLKDTFGHSHYVMVEPDNEDESFERGDMVLLVERRSAVFSVIAATSEGLVEE